MWWLKYSYKQKDGTLYTRSALIETGIENTLGRVSKNTFKIDKPSVSGVHLKFIIDPIEFPMRSPVLKLKILGQSATIDEELLNYSKMSKEQREELDYTVYKKSISVKISGVTIRFYNKLILLKLSNELAVRHELDFKRLGIPFTATYLPETTHLIKKQADKSLEILAAMLAQIPVERQEYIEVLVNRIDSFKESYEMNFPKSSEFLLDPAYAPNDKRRTLLNNLVFIFFDKSQYDYLTPILQIGGNETNLYDNQDLDITSVVQFVKENSEGEKQPVLVQPNISDEESLISRDLIEALSQVAKQAGLYLITNEDIFNSVLNLNTDILTRKRPPKLASVHEDDIEKPVKKKRRTKIKALDSLEYFGGGGSVPAVKDSLDPQMSQIVEVLETQHKDEEETPEPPKKKSRSRIKALDNGLIEGAESFVAKVSQDPVIDIPSTQKEATPEIDKEQNSDSKDDAILETSEHKAHSVTTKQHSFLSAAQSTKEDANRRFQEQLGSIEDMDADAISQLKDLSIVEMVDITLRVHTKKPIQSNATTLQEQLKHNHWDPRWTGRKNYKTFTKTGRKGNRNENNVFVQTHIRNYVPMELVGLDKAAKRNFNDELLEGNEINQQLERQQSKLFQKTNDSIRSSATGELSPSKRPEALFVVDSDSEDEDRVASFQFTTDLQGFDNADGLGMNVRITEGENSNIPEFRRFDNRRDIQTNGENFNGTGHVNSTLTNDNDNNNNNNDNENDDDDDDDDDDDFPKFRFRS